MKKSDSASVRDEIRRKEEGIDVAKCLSLGPDAPRKCAGQTLFELRTSMSITGARSLTDFRAVRKVITPPLTCWVG